MATKVIEVTTQLFDHDTNELLWAYHHREAVIPDAPDGPEPEDMDAAVLAAQHRAGNILLAKIDEAKESIARQIAATASINAAAARGD